MEIEVQSLGQVEILELMNHSVDWMLGSSLKPMLSEYGSKGIDLAQIIPLRQAVVENIELFLKRQYDSVQSFVADAMRSLIKSKKFLSILAMGLFARERQLRLLFAEKSILSSQNLVLEHYNYSYSVVLSSSSLNEMNNKLINLELFLRNKDLGKVERLVLELTQEELSQFIQKLQPLENAVSASE